MKNRHLFHRSLCLLLAAGLLSGCTQQNVSNHSDAPTPSLKFIESGGPPLSYEVTPETFALSLRSGAGTVPASAAGQTRTVSDFEQTGDETSWRYPDEQISVSIKPADDYLSVTVTADTESDQSFTWPLISAESYYLPFGEGKRVPAGDSVWADYLHEQEFAVLEHLSMPFWAAEYGDRAVLFILEDPFRTTLNFDGSGNISFAVSHGYPAIGETRANRFRVYLTGNDPVQIAKTYKNYVRETKGFLTLEQKAEKNPEIRKLYGAPFIYLWGEFVLSPEDVNWPAFRKALDSPAMAYLLAFSGDSEKGAEFSQALAEIRTQDHVNAFQKNIVCGYLSEVLKRGDFYDPAALPQSSPALDALLSKGYEALTSSERLQAHFHGLAANLPGVFHDVSTWMDAGTVNLIGGMKERGIDRAWIGLNSWEQADAKPALVSKAAGEGYLIGSYDSYHSIHEPWKEQWITAAFEDASLYENATVTDQNGEKISGFQGVGRKLNPTLSLPAVKGRMKRIMENGFPFNSWFIDCDATGEIYDDYTPEHVANQEADLAARLERMAYIRDAYGMVVGSEGGHDFAASTIAYAHGIELKSFSWMDQDMKANKDSEYYIGKYYSPTGGVAEHFSKRIPIKDNYYTLFADPRYDAPLFRLVYNDSVVTSYHWDWSTFKIKGATQERMVREVLYNVPPLYHLDAAEWEIYKDDIVAHTKVWSAFARRAVLQEMTEFRYLKEDGSVQQTGYGGELKVIANFGGVPYSHEGQEIPGRSALIITPESASIYTPAVSPENA